MISLLLNAPSMLAASPLYSVILGYPWGADIQSFFLQCFHTLTFSNLAFGCPSFLSFFPSESNPSLPSQRFSTTTSPYGSSFWVPQGTSLLLMSCCSLSPLVLCYITKRLRRTYLSFISCAFWFPF